MDKQFPERASFLALAALLVISFAFGGGGSRQGLANLLVQLVAIAVLVPHHTVLLRFWRESPLGLRLLIGASLLLPASQLVPLPPGIWSHLPGRGLVLQSLEMTGEAGWMPLSVNPLRTALAASALITPLAVLVLGWNLNRQMLVTLGWLAVALGIATLLFAPLQIGATDATATLYGSRRPGTYLLGTFANRNSTGLLLGFALALAALLPVPRPHPAVPFARAILCSLLLLAIVLTKSRTAIALAILPLGLAGIKAVWWVLRERAAAAGNGGTGPLLGKVLGAVTLLAVGTGALVVAAPGPIVEALERFEAKDDPRRFIWDDATYSAARYWPAGAGMGTFDEVFQVDESLENLTQRTAGRAHNDFIELAIEAGPTGLALAALWVALVVWLSWRARVSSHRWAAWAGSAFLLSITLQSITDYPLRNQTFLAFAGFALLLLARIANDQRRVRK